MRGLVPRGTDVGSGHFTGLQQPSRRTCTGSGDDAPTVLCTPPLPPHLRLGEKSLPQHLAEERTGLPEVKDPAGGPVAVTESQRFGARLLDSMRCLSLGGVGEALGGSGLSTWVFPGNQGERGVWGWWCQVKNEFSLGY